MYSMPGTLPEDNSDILVAYIKERSLYFFLYKYDGRLTYDDRLKKVDDFFWCYIKDVQYKRCTI